MMASKDVSDLFRNSSGKEYFFKLICCKILCIPDYRIRNYLNGLKKIFDLYSFVTS
jgi:hypothetical protein